MSKSVLIGEDSASTRAALVMVLKMHGYRVVGLARDGIEVIKKYKKLKPDFVLMDIAMPKKDGLAAIKEILEYDPKASIVAITAIYSEDKRRKAKRSGVKALVQKPFEVDELLRACAKAA